MIARRLAPPRGHPPAPAAPRPWLRVGLHELRCARGHAIWHRAGGADCWWQACGHTGCTELVVVVVVSPAEVRLTRITDAERAEIERRHMRLGEILEFLGMWADDPVAPTGGAR